MLAIAVWGFGRSGFWATPGPYALPPQVQSLYLKGLGVEVQGLVEDFLNNSGPQKC